MTNLLNRWWKLGISLLFGLMVFFFWWQCYPHALSYQEQYQLFPWTTDYFMQNLCVPGGLSAWLGEFIVQFYYIPWLGALLLAALFVLLQRLIWWNMGSGRQQWYLFSFIPPLLLLWMMGDESVLLSYPVALCLTLAAALLIPCQKTTIGGHIFDAVFLPVLYWAVGPVVWLYVALRIIRSGWKSLWTIVWLALLIMAAYHWLLSQWSLTSVLTGIVYYRIPEKGCMLMWLLPVVIVLLVMLPRKLNHRLLWVAETVIVALVAWLSVTQNYDREKYELIYQDYLVRNERWDDIIDRATKYQVQTPFSSVCVNLALAQCRQLADRQFDFWQSGPDALIMPRQRDLTSMLPSAETFWRLGMVNSAQRYMFDTQESILNARKSGRCTKRIVECMIVNGQYKTAAKHIDLLKKSLFYSQWAHEAETYLGDEAKINAHPVWGKIRQLRFKDDFLYSYPELDKIFYMLFSNNTDNKMALDYMLAQMLLNGNVPIFMQNLQLAQRYGGYSSMPLVYQDVVQCAQNGGAVEGSSYMNFFNRMRQTKQ